MYLHFRNFFIPGLHCLKQKEMRIEKHEVGCCKARFINAYLDRRTQCVFECTAVGDTPRVDNTIDQSPASPSPYLTGGQDDDPSPVGSRIYKTTEY